MTNTLKIYPKSIRDSYENNIINSGIETSPKEYHNKILQITFALTLITAVAFYFLEVNMLYSLIAFIVFNIFFYFKVNLKANSRIKQMEDFFPDVISLMASNLRSGITIERSFILAARPEFSPLDKEILKTGKEIATGKDVISALMNMSSRINSDKIRKTIRLIISGIKSGGNIATLLEKTSSNMKEKTFIERKAASTILMYIIFIFFTVSIGAPMLFALSSVLIEIIMNLTANMPSATTLSMDLPFAFSQIAISKTFIISFSVIFIISTDLISSMVIGLVKNGEEKAGLKLFLPTVALSLAIFFGTRIFLTKFLIEAFSLM